jgi:hypothetical protein
MGVAGRERIAAHFGLREMVTKIETVYESLLSEQPRRVQNLSVNAGIAS